MSKIIGPDGKPLTLAIKDKEEQNKAFAELRNKMITDLYKQFDVNEKLLASQPKHLIRHIVEQFILANINLSMLKDELNTKKKLLGINK